MNKLKEKNFNRSRRHKRVRAKITGTSECPRLSVFRSNKHIFLQLIDDLSGKTLVSANDLELHIKNKKTSVANAYAVGELAASKTEKLKLISIVFDRGAYKYHGAVKAVAEGLRKGGLKF